MTFLPWLLLLGVGGYATLSDKNKAKLKREARKAARDMARRALKNLDDEQ